MAGVFKKLVPWTRRPETVVKLKPEFKGMMEQAFIFRASGTLPLVKRNINAEYDTSYAPQGLRMTGGSNDRIELDDPVDLEATDECTVIFKFKRVTSKTHGIWCDKDGTDWTAVDGISINLRSDGGVLFNVGNQIAYTTTDYYDDGEWHTFILQYKNGDAHRIYVDNKEISYSQQDTGIAYTNNTLPTRIGTYYTGLTAYTMDGYLEYLYVLNKKIPIQQAFHIADNPYSIIEDQIKYIPYPDAATATTVGLFKKLIPWTRKPSHPTPLNKSHPYANNVALFYCPKLGDRLDAVEDRLSDLVTTHLGTTVNKGRPVAYLGEGGSASENIGSVRGGSTAKIGNEVSIFCITRPKNITGDAGHYYAANTNFFVDTRASGNTGIGYSQSGAIAGSPNPGGQRFTIWGVSHYVASGYNLNGADFQSHGCVAKSGSTVRFFTDHEFKQSKAIVTFTTLDSAFTISAQGPDAAIGGWNYVDAIVVLNKALSDDAYRRFSKDLYALLQPRTEYIPYPDAATAATVGLFKKPVPWTRKPEHAPLNKNHIRNAWLVYPFQGNTKDFGTKRLDGAITGNVNYQATLFGRGYYFDGVDDNISSGALGEQPPNEWAIEILFVPKNVINRAIATVAEAPRSGTKDRTLRTNGSSQLEGYLFDGVGQTITGTTTLTADKVYHAILSTNGADFELTLNGKLEASSTVSNGGYTGYATPQFIIGEDSGPTDFHGWVGFVVFHKRHIPKGAARKITARLNNYSLFQPRTELTPYSIPAAAAQVVGLFPKRMPWTRKPEHAQKYKSKYFPDFYGIQAVERGAKAVRDYANNEWLGTSDNSDNWGVDSDGPHLRYDGGTNKRTILRANSSPTTYEVTVYGAVKFHDATIDSAVFDVGNTAIATDDQNLLFWADTEGTTLRWGLYAGSGAFSASDSIKTGKKYNFCLRIYRSGGNTYVSTYVEGKLIIGFDINIGARDWRGTLQEWVLGANSLDFEAKSANMNLYGFNAKNGLLSHADCRHISKNVNTIFQPRTELTTYSTAVEEPPVTFKSFWIPTITFIQYLQGLS